MQKEAHRRERWLIGLFELLRHSIFLYLFSIDIGSFAAEFWCMLLLFHNFLWKTSNFHSVPSFDWADTLNSQSTSGEGKLSSSFHYSFKIYINELFLKKIANNSIVNCFPEMFDFRKLLNLCQNWSEFNCFIRMKLNSYIALHNLVSISTSRDH